MPVTFSSQQDTLTAYLAGELDHHSAAVIREAVDEMVESALPKVLVLDFENVPFMDSSGIGLIMGRYRTMESVGGSLSVEHASPQLKKLMNLGGLSRLPITIR